MLVIMAFLPDRHCNLNAHKLNFSLKEIRIPLEHFSKSCAALVAPHQCASRKVICGLTPHWKDGAGPGPAKKNRAGFIDIQNLFYETRTKDRDAGSWGYRGEERPKLTPCILLAPSACQRGVGRGGRKWRQKGSRQFAVLLHFDSARWGYLWG